MSEDNEKKQELMEISGDMFTALEKISMTSKDLTASMNNFTRYMEAVTDLFKETKDAVQQAGSIMNEIQTISVQSNLLSLNASIEAARAGEAGKGFAVVSQEMRSLSDMIKESSSNVTGMLEKMRGSIGDITSELSHITEAAGEQSGAVSEISASVEVVTEAAGKLAEIAKY